MPKEKKAITIRDDDGKAKLIKLRGRFDYCLSRFKDIKEEGAADMRFLAGDTWDALELQTRKDNNRPHLHFDELSQYPNQIINDVRQNKRGVKVNPEGAGSNDKSADLLEGWIRGIEYASQAQAAYTTMFENQLNRSYGFCKLQTFYPSPASFNLSAKICRIANPDTILFDPDCKEYDCSDAMDCFEFNFVSHEQFKRDWPNAEIQEFTEEIRQEAPMGSAFWITEQQVQIASYWKVEITKVKLYLIQPPEGEPKVMRADELPADFDPKDPKVLKTREIEDRRIVQTILNGVEILEINDPKDAENPKGWPGKWIPIIPCWGKELFVDEGNGSKRILQSLIRQARDPQRYYDYLNTLEMEEAALTPKTPYLGSKGAFENCEGWDTIHQVPRGYVEYNGYDDENRAIPPPTRVPFLPNFAAYQVAKESAKRAIQSAMGISPLPTAAARNNEKSGVALDRINTERAQGSYHFQDNYNRSIECVGRQLEDLYNKINDTKREIAIRKPNEDHKVITVNTDDPATKVVGDHSVTISTGPSYQSQREEASEFADQIAKLPGVFPIIGDLLVKLRNLGPIGDEIAQRLTPPQFQSQTGEPLPPQAIAAIGKLTQETQQLHAYAQKLEGEIKSLQFTINAKIVEAHSKERIAGIQEQTKLVVAQATLQRESAESILQAELDRIGKMVDQMHEKEQQANDAAAASAQSLQDHQQELEQQKNAAALQPPPADSGASAPAQ